MAMVKCPECGGNVSEHAITCPHCGYPLQAPNDEEKYVLSKGEAKGSAFSPVLILLGVIILIIGFYIAGTAANVTSINPIIHREISTFSGEIFFVSFVPYVIYSFIFFALASVVDRTAHIYDYIKGMKIEKCAHSIENQDEEQEAIDKAEKETETK